MESFPPENTEQAAKKQREQKFDHKCAAIVDNSVDDKKRQAAEIIYLERYE
jgi:hypothetical protein